MDILFSSRNKGRANPKNPYLQAILSLIQIPIKLDFRFSEKNHLYRPNLWKCWFTCSMRACGEWTKIEGLSLGDDSRHSCASVALGLYIKAIALESLPSYSNNLWCSSRKRSLSALNLNVPWIGKQGWGRQEEKNYIKHTEGTVQNNDCKKWLKHCFFNRAAFHKERFSYEPKTHKTQSQFYRITMAEFFGPWRVSLPRWWVMQKNHISSETAGLSAMFTQKELIIEEQIEKEPSFFSVCLCSCWGITAFN